MSFHLEKKYRQIARQENTAVLLSPDESRQLRSERYARIVAFSNRNARRPRWIALAWVIEELSTRLPDGSKVAYRDKAKEADAVRHMQVAIRAGDFSRRNIDDKKHERLLFLSPSEPFHFISRDEAIEIGKMTNVDHILDVMARMWAPRDTLATLFKKREWRLPVWLSEHLVEKIGPPRSGNVGTPSWKPRLENFLEETNEAGKSRISEYLALNHYEITTSRPSLNTIAAAMRKAFLQKHPNIDGLAKIETMVRDYKPHLEKLRDTAFGQVLK
jgi:hypothetical protein